jgi:hypothetical protein
VALAQIVVRELLAARRDRLVAEAAAIALAEQETRSRPQAVGERPASR